MKDPEVQIMNSPNTTSTSPNEKDDKEKATSQEEIYPVWWNEEPTFTLKRASAFSPNAGLAWIGDEFIMGKIESASYPFRHDLSVPRQLRKLFPSNTFKRKPKLCFWPVSNGSLVGLLNRAETESILIGVAGINAW